MVQGLVRKAERDPEKARQLVGVARLSHGEMTSGLLQAKACVVRRTFFSFYYFTPLILVLYQDTCDTSRSTLEDRYLRLKVKTLTAALNEMKSEPTDFLSRPLLLSKAPSSSTHHGKTMNRTADSEDLVLKIMHMTRTLQGEDHSRTSKDIAKCLDNWSVTLHELGMYEEACEMSASSVKMHRLSLHDEQNHNLATALHNYSNHLNHLGNRIKDALKASQSAEAIFRRLVGYGHGIFNADLALSLNNTSNCLRLLGYLDDALKKTREAVKIHKSLSEQDPGSFNADFAMSLSHLSNRLLDRGHREDALKAATSAHHLYQSLYLDSPNVFAAEYASSLDTYLICLAGFRRYEEAVDPAMQAIKIWRGLVENRPNVFRCRLARALENAFDVHHKLGRHSEALQFSSKAADQYRQSPKEFRPDLGSNLSRAGSCLLDLGRHEEALKKFMGALRIFDRCAKAEPTPFNSRCADALDNLYHCFTRGGDHKSALESAGRAVRIRHSLAGKHARTRDLCARLATSCTYVFHSFRKLGSFRKALDAIQEAVTLYRELVADSGGDFNADLTMALYNTSQCLGQLRCRDQALTAAREAVDIHRNRGDRSSDRYHIQLARYLMNVSGCFSDVGRKNKARSAADEAIRICPGMRSDGSF
jgi:tetratricopeptide (TPR) repeat protein